MTKDSDFSFFKLPASSKLAGSLKSDDEAVNLMIFEFGAILPIIF
jgi:hypothetical protein